MPKLTPRERFDRDLKTVLDALGPVELARRLGVSRQTLFFWQRGAWPRADHYLALGDLLNAILEGKK